MQVLRGAALSGEDDDGSVTRQLRTESVANVRWGGVTPSRTEWSPHNYSKAVLEAVDRTGVRGVTDGIRWEGRPLRALLSGKEEDRFTASLCELLRSPLVLQVFIEQICGLRPPPTAFQSISVEPQATVPGGRPDVLIRGNGLALIIEAKVDSWLHEDQVVPYAEALLREDSSGKRALYLLVPAESVKAAEATAQDQLAAGRLAPIDVRGISWEQVGVVLGELAKQPDIESRLVTHLDDFADLMRAKFGLPMGALNQEAAKVLGCAEVGRLLLHAEKLAYLVVTGLQARFDVKSVKWSSQHSQVDGHYIGFNFAGAGHFYWFGLWYEAWAAVGGSPFFLEFSDETVEDIRKAGYTVEATSFEGSRNPVVPVPVPGGLEPADMADLLAPQLGAWLCLSPKPKP